MIGQDGREYVSVTVAKSRAFAAACLTEWQQLDGRDRSDWLRRKAINVPAEVVPAARARLEKRKATASH
ncbi:MAG TPA: hypothetical protein VGN80_19230 [Devosiaceae bacterium]|jgi:hypothetical protein|nr:hypothetical protein [Devosiaceae bacterium]